MKAHILAILVCSTGSFFALAQAQDRGAELDKAVEEVRVAHLALKEAERRRDQGVESQPGERLGTVGSQAGGGKAGKGIAGKRAGGGSRQSDEYWERQAQLERDVERARQRYEAAQKRWNDLK